MRQTSTSDRWWLTLAILLGGVSAVFAHDPGLSSADVKIGPTQITVALTVNERDWGSTGIMTPEAIRNECVKLTLDGVSILPISSSGPIPDHIQNVGCVITYPKPAPGKLTIASLLFDRYPFGHRDFVQVHDAGGHLLMEQMLREDSPSCEVSIISQPGQESTPVSQSTFLSFLAFGIQHILTGYDHMLFLAGLLLVCTSFRQAASVVTYFTAAHSLTLALSALNILTITNRFVEPAVAASITYVGLENIFRPQDMKWRGPIAFGFGLVHGLGFASILRAMGIGSGHTGFVVPLLSFNLGVELGQLSVALAVLPVIFILRTKPAFPRFGTPAISAVIALLGTIWFLQRTIMA